MQSIGAISLLQSFAREDKKNVNSFLHLWLLIPVQYVESHSDLIRVCYPNDSDMYETVMLCLDGDLRKESRTVNAFIYSLVYDVCNRFCRE